MNDTSSSVNSRLCSHWSHSLNSWGGEIYTSTISTIYKLQMVVLTFSCFHFYLDYSRSLSFYFDMHTTLTVTWWSQGFRVIVPSGAFCPLKGIIELLWQKDFPPLTWSFPSGCTGIWRDNYFAPNIYTPLLTSSRPIFWGFVPGASGIEGGEGFLIVTHDFRF